MLPDLREKKVALVGCGDSVEQYVKEAFALGSPRVLHDEVWVINAAGGLFDFDRMFCMDGVGYVLDNEPGTLKWTEGAWMWMPNVPSDKPIYTSTPDPRVPASVAYPLEEVFKACPVPYYVTSGAYALAFAKATNVGFISLYGTDFGYGADHADTMAYEIGRANFEYWLGVLQSGGCAVRVCKGNQIMNVNFGPTFYGYRNPPKVKPHINLDTGITTPVLQFTAQETEDGEHIND